MPSSDWVQHLTTLMTQVQQQGTAAAASGLVPRTWQIPSTFPSSVDVQNPQGFVVACDRSVLNAAAIEAYQTGDTPNGGRLGTIMATKLAIDHQAAYERMLHARHASGLRLRVWASGRRTGHGDTTYGIYAAISRNIDSIEAAATAVPNST